MAHTIEGALIEHGLNFLSLLGATTFACMDHGPRAFSFPQVPGHWLAQDIFRCSQIEDVVHDLEGHAEIASVLCQALFLLGSGSAENASHAHTDREQASGFAIDEIEVLGQRYGVTEFFHLQQLPLDHLLCEFDQRIQYAEVTLLHSNLEGLHVEPVACKHAFGISPLGISGGAATAYLSFIDNVIVNECGRVDDLDYRTQPDSPPALVVKQLR